MTQLTEGILALLAMLTSVAALSAYGVHIARRAINSGE
jgi:hypothetical protein